MKQQTQLPNQPAYGAFTPLVPSAIKALEKAVKAGDLRAIKIVFDLVWGKPRCAEQISRAVVRAGVIVLSEQTIANYRASVEK